MKTITDYINESQHTEIDPKTIKGPLTPAEYNGEAVVIIGKPFTNDRDEAYIMAKELIKKLGYGDVTMDLKDCYENMPDAEDVDYWVFAYGNDEVSCFEYGPSGVAAYK